MLSAKTKSKSCLNLMVNPEDTSLSFYEDFRDKIMSLAHDDCDYIEQHLQKLVFMKAKVSKE
mgnify:CR=1 FL=1